MITRLVQISPTDALRLNEDAFAIKQAIRLLETVDHYSAHDDPIKGRRMLRSSIGMLKQCQRHAEHKLLMEFLVPPKKRMNGRERTVSKMA